VLSRIAESLYWIGRYVERAEGTARILDIHIHYLLEGPSAHEPAACQLLLDIMGAGTGGGAALDARGVTELLAFDGSYPSSIVSSLSAARANARGVSETISVEIWEAINATYNALPTQVGVGRQVGPYAFFRYVRERSAVINGITDSSMIRDDAWWYLVLGRSLERVDMMARLLTAGLREASSDPEWVILLRSCGAYEAFLRAYAVDPTATLAAEFLMLDRLFPKSIVRSLTIAEECLANLDPRTVRVGTSDEARRLLALARTGLEYRRISELFEDLHGELDVLQETCRRVNGALGARYFRRTDTIEWLIEDYSLPEPEVAEVAP
jgi:uncharacterized alpha-E superfamily protein